MDVKSRLVALLLSLLLLAVSVNAVDGGINEGEEATFTVNGNAYTVRADFIHDERAKFSHNSETSNLLVIGGSYTFSDHLNLTLQSINMLPLGAWVASIKLKMAEYCGDKVCNAGETCSSCQNDCGYCPATCGDSVCAPGETCNSDNCCNGKITHSNNCCDGQIVDLNTDYFNCGGCNKKCSGYETCKQGKCVPPCGNNKCDSGEDYNSCPSDCKRPVTCGDKICDSGENCCLDCGCREGYSCRGNTCISRDECLVNDDCDDDNDCTQDLCTDTPKKCRNIVNESCLIGSEEKETAIKESQSLNNEIETVSYKEDSVPKQNKTDQDISDQTPTPKRTIFSRIINWFVFMFS